MAFSYNKKNLANTTITGAITPTQTSVTVADATVFSYAFFYATLMPSNEMSNASNSEIVLVTNIQGNTLTLVRGQENTIARSFPYGAVITNGIYTRDIDYARSIGRKVFMARDDGTDDTNTSYQITDPMIKNVPEEGSIITVEFDTPSYGAPTLGVNNGIGGLVQVSGTDIHITDSSGQIDSVEMYGDTEQTTYSGKNLAYPLPKNVPDEGITATYNAQTGEITLSGTAVRGYSIPFQTVDVSIPAGTYTIKQFGTLTHGRMGINFRRANGTQFAEYVVEAGTLTNTFTLTEAAAKIYLFTLYHAQGQTVEGTVKFQLEAGSTATSFEPYVGGTASPNPDYPQNVNVVTGEQTITISDGGSQSVTKTVNLGKNLLKLGDTSTTVNGIIFTPNVDGSFDLSGTATANAEFNVIVPLADSGIKSGEKYTFSTNNSNVFYFVFNCDENGTWKKTLMGFSGSQTQTVTCPDTIAGYVNIIIRVPSGTTINATNVQTMLEKGSSATPFAPYFTPIELCKIGTYQDYIYKSGEDWYVHKEIEKSSMGSLTWNPASTGTSGVYRMYSDGIRSSVVIPATGSEIAKIVCSHYTPETAANTWSTMVGVAVQTTDGRLFVYDSNYNTNTSQSAFTTWLINNNVGLYYALATATDTQITNSALTAQLNALYNMLPEGVADVVVTGDLPGSLTIKYYQQGTGTFTAPIVGGAEIDGGDNEQVVELDSYLPYRLVYDTNGYWRVLNKGPKVTTGAIMDGAVTAAKITRDNINYGTTSSDTRIGTFLGKPLWRRVEKFTNIPTGYSVHNWAAGTIANLDSIVAVNGMWVASGSTTYVPINSLPPDAVTTYGIAIRDFTASSWAVVLGTSMNTVNSGYIILDYTKTS